MRPHAIEMSARHVTVSSELLACGVLQRYHQRWIRLPAFLWWVGTLVALSYVVLPRLVSARKNNIPKTKKRRSNGPDPIFRILEEDRARQAISQQFPIIINSQEIPTSYNTMTRHTTGPWCQAYFPNSTYLAGDLVPIRGHIPAQDSLPARDPTQTRSKGTQTDRDQICPHGNWAGVGCGSCADDVLGNVPRPRDPVPNRSMASQTECWHGTEIAAKEGTNNAQTELREPWTGMDMCWL